MSEYLLMIREDEAVHAAEAPKAMAELIELRAAFSDELRRAGRLRDSGRFRPSKEGKRVRRSGDRLELRDGPFTEEGTALSGYHWLEAPSADDAGQLALRCPSLASDVIDVTPLMKGGFERDRDAQSGKIFACAVLGNAQSEQAWVSVMDQIDAETHDRFPEASFLGGLRLQPPKSGRRIATRGERRAMFDGPFLESKEVIGGLFFLRMTSIDQAVLWAAETRFVVHGALEIRELWRS